MTVPAISRGLTRALHAAIATLVLAIAGAIFFADADGERFATVAYLAAIFIAIVLACRLAVQRRYPREAGVRATFIAPIPFVMVVAVALAVSAGLASSLAAEALVILGCFALVAGAAALPEGLLAPAHRLLITGGGSLAVRRYAVAAGMLAWGLAAVVPSLAAVAARFGYAMLAFAGLLIIVAMRPLDEIVPYGVNFSIAVWHRRSPRHRGRFIYAKRWQLGSGRSLDA